MSEMQLLAEGLQKIAQRREKMTNIYKVCHLFLEQAVNVASTNSATYTMDDDHYDAESLYICMRARDGRHEDKEDSAIITVGIHANGEINVSGMGLDVHQEPVVFDFDDYGVSDTFAKIITSIENLDGNYFGPHLRHVQNDMMKAMKIAPANEPKPTR